MEKNLSIILSMELFPLSKKSDKGYIFSYSENGVSLTAYVKGQFIYVGIFETNILKIKNRNSQGDTQDLFLKVDIRKYFNKPHLFSFSYSTNGFNHKIIFYLDNKKVEEKDFTYTVDNSFINIYHSLGCSAENKNFGKFKLFQQMTFSNILEKKDLKNIYEYVKKKTKSCYVIFEGNQFLFKNLSDNSLVQPNKKYQPRYVKG